METQILDLIGTYFSKNHENNLENTTHENNNLITTPNILIEELKEKFNNPNLSTHPLKLSEYQNILLEKIFPYLVNTASPFFIGHMTSALPNFHASLLKIIVLLNQNMVKIETSKVLVFLERQSIGILHKLFYENTDEFYKTHLQNFSSNLGQIVADGTIANLTALWVAMNCCFKPDKNFKGLSNEGLFSALMHYQFSNAVILVSPLAHYSFEKSASILGLGKMNLKKLQLTPEGVVDLEDLNNTIINCRANKTCIVAIVGIAGATETGSIDPLEEIALIAREAGIHFHVDAAFGGPILFSTQHKKLLKGIELADSITVCGHKQLYLPMGISLCLFRDPEKMECIATSTDYQAMKGSYDFGQYSLEGSRPAISLALHASLCLLGKTGYEKLIDIGFENAQYLRSKISSSVEFELLWEPTINIVNYRYIPQKYRTKLFLKKISQQDNIEINKANILLQEKQFLAGKTFISKTFIPSNKYSGEIVTLRAVLANPLTTKTDIDKVLEDQINLAGLYIESLH